MDNRELGIMLGEIKQMLHDMHGDLLENRSRIDSNSGQISELNHFRSRMKGAATLGGILTAAVTTVLGVLAKMKGLI